MRPNSLDILGYIVKLVFWSISLLGILACGVKVACRVVWKTLLLIALVPVIIIFFIFFWLWDIFNKEGSEEFWDMMNNPYDNVDYDEIPYKLS